jgi:hypothetical protein
VVVVVVGVGSVVRKYEQVLLTWDTRLVEPQLLSHVGRPAIAVGATEVSRTDEYNEDTPAACSGARKALRQLLLLQTLG